ncbi:MAG: response regulator [Bdellovibrionota bacterium]
MAEAAVRILIVEDVENMCRLLKDLLSSIDGIAVSGFARNGWEARREILRNRPDLVLLDEVLPGESSIDLLNEFNSQGLLVILLTGMKDANHQVHKKALGRIYKPSLDNLVEDKKRVGEAIFSLIRHRHS